jgi:hypothetical protein
MSEELVPRDYVYCGQRLSQDDKERSVVIRVIGEDGTLGKELYYKYSRDFVGTIGGIYTGAKFSDTKVQGFNQTRYKGRWDNSDDRLLWQMRDEEVETRLKLKKLEADDGRVSDLQRALTDARALYEKHYRAFDSAGCRALEQAVLAALRTPLRKIEKDA